MTLTKHHIESGLRALWGISMALAMLAISFTAWAGFNMGGPIGSILFTGLMCFWGYHAEGAARSQEGIESKKRKRGK